MSIPVKPNDGSRNSRHRNLIIISLVVAVLFTSLVTYMSYMYIEENAEVLPTYVSNETELTDVINAARNGIPNTIILNNDIFLNAPLIISGDKDITLASNSETEFFKLFGANNRCTIQVTTGSVLRIDGICITHVEGDYGQGVYVHGGGLIMYDGAIFGNNFEDSYGGGVSVYGTFDMHGGKIYGNTAMYGGGVNVYGIFTMTAGEIYGNIATNTGGGVYNSVTFNHRGTFNWYGGEIYGNTADNDENVYNPE